MDPVSQLIMENIEQAKVINCKLVKNDEQLHRVKKNNLEITQDIKLGEKILNSFSTLFSYWKNLVSWNKNDELINEKNYESNLELNSNSNSKVKELRELTDNMSKMLDSQNETLSQLNSQVNHNLNNLSTNQNKIKKLLDF